MSKVVFLCANPWENLVSGVNRSNSREYFQKLFRHFFEQNESVCYQELIENYGEANLLREECFWEGDAQIQLFYVQGKSEVLLKELFEKADLVLMRIPATRREFDQMYMTIFPWLRKIMFFLDDCHWTEPELVGRLCRDYKLQPAQVIRVNIQK